MMMPRLTKPLAYLASTVGAAAGFVLTTSLMDQATDAVVIGAPLLIAALISLSGSWRLVVDGLRSKNAHFLSAAVGGIAMLWLAPMLALMQRATDAPSGSETLFFTTAGWGLLAGASGLLAQSGRRRFLQPASAVLALAGCAGLLANWERPSSFSPFAKFPTEELMMIGAGIIFVAGAYLLSAASRSIGTRASLPVALTAAAVAGLAFVLPTLDASVGLLSNFGPQIVFLGAAVFSFAWGMLNLVAYAGVPESGASLLVVPVALTALSILERSTGAYGADPIVWSGVFAGGAVCLSAATALAFSSAGRDRVPPEALPRRWNAALWAVVMACTAALAALWLPAIRAVSEGTFGEPFRAAWTMVGAESAAGWVAASAGLLCLSAVLAVGRLESPLPILCAAVAVFAAACAYPFLLDTTLHTWNSWIPPEVLTSYGTEYARFTVNGIWEPVRSAAVAVFAVVAVALFAYSIRTMYGSTQAQLEVDE